MTTNSSAGDLLWVIRQSLAALKSITAKPHLSGSDIHAALSEIDTISGTVAKLVRSTTKSGLDAATSTAKANDDPPQQDAMADAAMASLIGLTDATFCPSCRAKMAGAARPARVIRPHAPQGFGELDDTPFD